MPSCTGSTPRAAQAVARRARRVHRRRPRRASARFPARSQSPTTGPMLVPRSRWRWRAACAIVGEPVAFVVAETRTAARDAAELVEPWTTTPLPCVVDARDGAGARRAASSGPTCPATSPTRSRRATAAAVRAAMAGAAHVVELDAGQQPRSSSPRSSTAPRSAATTRRPSTFRPAALSGRACTASATRWPTRCSASPRDAIEVSAPDVGGGFGVKNALYPEYILLLWAARQLGRPVRWASDHGEDFVSTAHGRDNLTRARLALDARGAVPGAGGRHRRQSRRRHVHRRPRQLHQRAGQRAWAAATPSRPSHMHVRGAYTNTVPIDAYRGAGKPEANYLLERLIDAAASPARPSTAVELRRRNLVDAFPAPHADGDHDRRRPLRRQHRPGARRRRPRRVRGPARSASAARGRLRGIGVTCFLETARGAPDEGAEIRFGPDGSVTLLLGIAIATARATRPASRSSPPTCSGCRSTRSATCRPTPR